LLDTIPDKTSSIQVRCEREDERCEREVKQERCEREDVNMSQLLHIEEGGVKCDGFCGVYPIRGDRYKCKNDINFDLCANCFGQIGPSGLPLDDGHSCLKKTAFEKVESAEAVQLDTVPDGEKCKHQVILLRFDEESKYPLALNAVMPFHAEHVWSITNLRPKVIKSRADLIETLKNIKLIVFPPQGFPIPTVLDFDAHGQAGCIDVGEPPERVRIEEIIHLVKEHVDPALEYVNLLHFQSCYTLNNVCKANLPCAGNASYVERRDSLAFALHFYTALSDAFYCAEEERITIEVLKDALARLVSNEEKGGSSNGEASVSTDCGFSQGAVVTRGGFRIAHNHGYIAAQLQRFGSSTYEVVHYNEKTAGA